MTTIVWTWGRCLGLALLSMVAIGAGARELPRYRCERLAGADLDGQNAYTTGINGQGEVVGLGFFARRLNLITAARWKSDGEIEYLVHNRWHSGAYGINDAGQVAGYVMLRDGGDHPAVWVDGVPELLPSLSGQRRSIGNAAAINNQGLVVGFTNIGPGILRRATLWDHGRAIDLGALDAQHHSAAVAINEHGVAVGSSDLPSNASRAVQWVDGVMQELGTLPGGIQSQASGISLDGLVVGSSDSAEHPYRLHATAWRHGEVIDLGTLPGDAISEAHAVSPDGAVIVGQSWLDDAYLPRAVAWFGDGGEPVALDELVVDGGCRDEKGNPRALTSATGVNGQGDIAATAVNYAPKGGSQASVFRLKRL